MCLESTIHDCFRYKLYLHSRSSLSWILIRVQNLFDSCDRDQARIDVDADSAASVLSERKMPNEVIDLLSSSDDENSGDEGEAGGATIASILREHFPGMQGSESRDHQPQNGGETESMKIEKAHRESDVSIYSSDSSADEEKDPFDSGKFQSLEFLRNHCWGCHIWVDHPGFESDESNDNICYNALHLHPILAVPMCVVCAETIETVERKHRTEKALSNYEEAQRPEGPSAEDEKEDVSTTCNTCGSFEFCEDRELYVRCDACQRAVCRNCYEQAHRSLDGSDGKMLSSIRKRPRPTSVQKCICCSSLDMSKSDEGTAKENRIQNSQSSDQDCHNLPPFLEKLRNLTQQLFSSSDSKTKQSLEDMIDLLNTLEIEKRSCESHLDDPKYLLDMVKEEMSEELGDVEDDVFEIRVQGRYMQRREEWIHHQTRLMDRITIIGDQLKADHGLEAAAVLRYIEATNNASETRENDDNETGSDEGEPLFKVAADYELAKRDRDERIKRRKEEKRVAQKSGDDPRYLVELTSDAEDLDFIDDDVKEANNGGLDDDEKEDAYDNGWRNAPFTARKRDIEAAMKAEDKRRFEEGKMNLIRCSKDNDMDEMKNWDSGLKSSAMIIKKKSNKRKRKSTRTSSKQAGNSSLTTSTSPAVSRSPQRSVRRKSMDENFGSAAFGGERVVSKGLEQSEFVLSKDPSICVPKNFDIHLKHHQKDGISFMYEKTFADLGQDEHANIGGCILAHSMGLGTLTSEICVKFKNTFSLNM